MRANTFKLSEFNERLDKRMKELLAQSKQKYGLSAEPDWRYPYFFDFLQISPSYRTAHLLSTKLVTRTSLRGKLPPDFEQVMETYKVFGDVWHNDWWGWWVKTAQHAFGVRNPPKAHKLGEFQPRQMADNLVQDLQAAVEQYAVADRLVEGLPAALILALPLEGRRSEIMKSLGKIVDEGLKCRVKRDTSARYSVLVNKVRRQTLDDARRIARARAALPTKPLYVIGNRAKVASQYVTPDSGKLLKADNRRKLMAIVTSRQLNRALIFSENAARGKFPSLDPVDAMDFDVMELRRSIIVHREWMKEQLAILKGVQAKKKVQGK